MAKVLTLGEKKCRQSTNSLPGHEEVDHCCLISEFSFITTSSLEDIQVSLISLARVVMDNVIAVVSFLQVTVESVQPLEHRAAWGPMP